MPADEPSRLAPKLRFPEFRGDPGWSRMRGDAIFDQINNRVASPGLPVLAITQEHGAIPRDQIDYHVSVTQESVASYKEVREGDFIISLRSFQGGIEYSRYHGICSAAYVVLRQKGHGDDRFYRQLFKSDRFVSQLTRNIEGLRDGKMISFAQFSEQLLPVPKVAEQRKIADCLGSLDDLIAAENRKLEALRRHKQGLMQQLFPKPGDLMPKLRLREFVRSGEWRLGKFGDFVIKSFYGTSEPTAAEGEYPVLRMGNMQDGRLTLSSLVYLDLDQEQFVSLQLERGDILLNRTNSPDLVGKIAIFDHDVACLTASYIVVFRLDHSRIDPRFCNMLLNTPVIQQAIKRMATPSISQSNINPTTFKNNLRITSPNLPEQHAITTCLDEINEVVISQASKVVSLNAYKKGLIQQLFPSPEHVA